MRSWTQPTADELARIGALAARPENRAYFFDRLKNPEWVAPLQERGFFADPPAPLPAGEPGYVRFPPWPEGRYLTRVAADAPDAVAAVLDDVGPSDNPAVTRQLLEAAAALPRDALGRLSTRIREWLGAPHADFFTDAAADVVSRLVEAEDIDGGLAAAELLLEIQPDPGRSEKAAAGDSHLRAHPEPVGRLSDWEYARAVERVLDVIVDHAGLRGVRLFASLLEDALRLSRWEDDPAEADGYSHIWRAAIEDHAQNSDMGVKNVLVSAVRDSAVRFAGRSDTDLEAVVVDLEARSLVHRRIALHLLASSEGGAPLAAVRIADRALFDDHRLRHEYAALLRARFGDAEQGVRRTVLGWISDGPDVAAYQRRRTEFDGSPPSDTETQRYVDAWRRDWYSFIAEYLTGRDLERYEELVSAVGQPKHPEFLSWSSSWTGPESPLAADEMLERSPIEVVDYLRSWRPEDDSGWHFGPSIEGLGRVLATVVEQRAEDYAPIASRLVDLDPTYVRSFFAGLDSTLRAGRTFPWQEPLKLAGFAAAQAFEPDEDAPDRDRDPGWRWCRREVASLLRSGFADRDNGIPFEFRGAAWQLLARLAGDPNPSPEHERRYGGENMDPFTLSINTNRGTVLHAVVEYALWCRRQLEASGEDVSEGFDLFPEVRSVLEHHLDPQEDPSLAVRSVYGRWLPWLLLLDEPWVLEHLDQIFPTAPDVEEFRDTAWVAYISWCPPYDSVFRVLRSEYDSAVQRVPSGLMSGALVDDGADEKLGEHLVTFYWRGVADEATVDGYFHRASDELASTVMGFVGRALHNTEGDVALSVRERIQTLWERRLRVAEDDPEAHSLEARTFGMSFASAKLDDEWALNALERSVQIGGAPRLGHLVVKRLVDVVVVWPAAAVRVLAAILSRPDNEWDFVSWRDEARAIVSAAASKSDPTIAQHCETIVDFYVSRGELDFRELLGARRV